MVILNSPRRGSTVDADLVDETTEAELIARASAAGVTAQVDHADHGHDLVVDVRGAGEVARAPG